MALTAKLEAQGNSVPSATAIQLPPKKPAQSHNFYLRARIWYVLCNIDRIIPRKLRYEVQDRLWSLWRELRDSRGSSSWVLVVAAAFTFGFICLAHPWAKTRVYCALPGCTPQTSFRVLKQYSERDFLLQRVVDGIPEPPEVRRFDEKPMFEIGFTLAYLKFEDRGDRWSIKHIDPYFRALRDDKGWPVLPPNCTNAWKKPVVCDGVPKW
jgi:hypothetical protein